MTASARLADRLGRSPLAVVVAPAGYGKTTLLRAWRVSAGATAWGQASFDAFARSNALDAGQALVQAAKELGVAAGPAERLLALLPPGGQRLGGDFVEGIADLMRALPHAFVLALDDVHGLPSDAALDLGRLVSMVADDPHWIVVATRKDPPWPIHRWQVAGFADLVSSHELKLPLDEVASLLPPQLRVEAPRVLAATGGWAAAVETVRWRLQVDPTVEVEQAVFDLVDYVRDEMLPALEPSEARILTRTSVLEPFPATVARAVADDLAAPAVLDRLTRRTSLVTRAHDGRFAYHPVLREALRRQLLEAEPATERPLQLRAAQAWLDEPDPYGGMVNAVNHLLEAHDWDQVVLLVRRRWAEMDGRSRFDLVVQWFDAVPEQHWTDDVELMLLYIWANLRIGRGAQALQSLQSPTIAGNPRAAAVARTAYASSIAWSSDPREAAALVEQVRPVLASLDDEPLPGDLPAYPGVAGFVLAGDIVVAQADVMTGRFGDAADRLEQVLRARADIAPTTVLGLRGARAFALAMQGEVLAASESCDEALRLAADTGTSEHVRAAPALIAWAAVATLQGDRALALERLNHAARNCRPVRAANLLRMADLVGAMCGLQTSFLADVDPPLASSPLPLVDQVVAASSARRRARHGDAREAELELHMTTPHELALSSWVEVLLEARDRRAVERWLRSQPNPTSTHAQVVRSLALAATCERGDDVTRHAADAARAAAPGHLLGVLIDAPAQLWARPTVTNSAHPLLIEAAQQVVMNAQNPAADALTPRELDLLRLLPLSLSVNELAERLFVSVSTVKWHRAHLYRKLGATDRRAAIVAGTERGLLTPRRPRS